MPTDEISIEEDAPLFSHFLNIKGFLILFVAGCVAMIAWIHMSGSVENVAVAHALSASAEIGLGIFIFLAPTVYYLVKRIRKEFKTLFEKDLPSEASWSMRAGFSNAEQIGYLFPDNTEFSRYRHEVHKMLNDSREKYIVLGLAFCLILPLTVLQDIQRGLLSSVFSGPSFLWSAVEYFYYTVYWSVVFSLLLSVVWMIVTVTRALLNLEKERPNLHMTKSIEQVYGSLRSSKQTDLSRAKVGLLDLSFRRFKAGLSPIVSFVLVLSLEIAFVGVFCSVPALAYFLLTKDVRVFVWYGLCVSSCLLSVVVFVIGQYGVWRLWASSKKDILKLLDHICAEKTEKCSDLYSLRTSSAQKEAKEVERYVGFVQRTSIDLNQLTTMTYTSSAIFKLVSVNFLSFAPLLVELILVRLWL